MTPRRRNLVATASALALAALVLYTVSAVVFLAQFSRLEDQSVRRDLSRAVAVFGAEMNALESKAGDWANGDAVCQFLDHGDPRFVARNLLEETFRQLDVNVILFFDIQYNLLFARAVDLESGTYRLVPPELVSQLTRDERLLDRALSDGRARGMVALAEAPMMVALRRVRNSGGQRLCGGVLLFGRMLDAPALARLGGIAQLQLELVSYRELTSQPEFTQIREALSVASPMAILTVDGSRLTGYAALYHNGRQPSWLLRAELPREIYQQGWREVVWFLGSLLLIFLVFGLLAGSMLRRLLVTERAGQVSEERYRAVVTQAVEGILLVDPVTGQISEMNVAAEKLLGLGPQQWRQLQASAIDLRSVHGGRDTLQHLIGVSPRFSGERQVQRPDQSWVHVEVRVNRLVLDQAALSCVVLHDITERKRAEREHARLHKAVEQAAESIMITDTQGAIVYVNPSFERTTGYTRAEVLGQNARLLKSEKQGEEFFRDMWSRLARGEVWSGDFINRRKDGSIYEEEAVISPVRNEFGRIENFVAVKRDVTYERQMEEQLRQAQKMDAMGRLAGGLAHDFNNILTVITGYGELLLADTPAHDPRRRFVEEVLQATARAGGLTRRWLAFSRKDHGTPQVVDLNQLVSGFRQMVQRLIGETVELRTVTRAEPATVRADPGQIEQVLMNLAVNGRDAMPQGGTLTIETASVEVVRQDQPDHADIEPGRYVLLAVSDTGCGMSETVRGRLFEPFFTTKPAGKGTGLGLSTCHGIVKQSGGYIHVYSEENRGTTFRVYLPCQAGVPGRESLPAPGRDLPRGRETVLLIEDEDMVRELAKEVLRELGYTVIDARNGREGLRLAGAHAAEITLVMTDMVLPDMSGQQVVEQLCVSDPALRVFFTSGYPQEAILPAGGTRPAALFLEKPFASADLARKVRQALDQPVAELLPLAPVPRSGAAALAPARSVLLVDDEPPMRQLVGRALSDLGFEVLEAGDGIEALEVAGRRHQEIDLLVTDVAMPRMGGLDLAARMRLAYPQIKILFLSGHALPEGLAVGGVLDETYFLSKPFRRVALQSKVREVLGAG